MIWTNGNALSQQEDDMLSNEHIGIMEHTLKNGIFCGGGKEMDELCEAGLMAYAGRKSFVPDPYYKITGLGKKYLDNK